MVKMKAMRKPELVEKLATLRVEATASQNWWKNAKGRQFPDGASAAESSNVNAMPPPSGVPNKKARTE